MLQFRPLGRNQNVKDPMYSPHRDIAHIGPDLITLGVIAAIECSEKEPWYKAILDYFGVSRAALEQYSTTLANLFSMLDRDIDVALKQSGFSSLSPAVQVGFYVKMGQALLAAIHCGLRDITSDPSEPPKSVKKMVEDIKEAVKKIKIQ